MPAMGLNPYKHHVDFDEWRLAHVVSFLRHLSEELGLLHAALWAALDREGVWAAIAVAARILSGLHHYDPLFLVDAVLDELAPADRRRALRAVVPYAGTVVRLEKEGDFGGA